LRTRFLSAVDVSIADEGIGIGESSREGNRLRRGLSSVRIDKLSARGERSGVGEAGRLTTGLTTGLNIGLIKDNTFSSSANSRTGFSTSSTRSSLVI